MTIFVVGHRGVGKTSFVKRYIRYLASTGIIASRLDLDEYIERKENQKVTDIFKNLGEKEFRKLEKQCFHDILLSTEDGISIVSLGAGFDVSLIPSDYPVLWLQRDSDYHGRIFLDRPRLEAELDPISEFKKRFEKREPAFQNISWEEYVVPEGIKENCEIEKTIFSNHLKKIGGALTLTPNHFKSAEKWKYFIEKRLYWGLDYFEIRDDLLPLEYILNSLEIIPKANVLFAYRKGKPMDPLINLKRVALIDWPLELGEPRTDQFNVISLHRRNKDETLEHCFKQLEKYNKQVEILKLAVEIKSFDELLKGHEWQQQDPKKRVFLPRSHHGKWEWYRLFMRFKMPLNFIREGRSKVLDQPTLHSWLRTAKVNQSFAAVLGSPVSHSYTPIEHYEFFSQRKMSVYAIDIQPNEFNEAMSVLVKLGLKAAAVTSPLKELAFELSKEKCDSEAKKFQSVNTLILKNSEWQGTNTDFAGLHALFTISDSSEVAVWGGGGTLPLIREVLPQAHYYSARTGSERDTENKSKDVFHPKYLVWAAPRADGKDILMPPKNWKPEMVFDLNYRDDSGGKEYAQIIGSKYKSGESMFLAQAEEQRKFWGEFL